MKAKIVQFPVTKRAIFKNKRQAAREQVKQVAAMSPEEQQRLRYLLRLQQLQQRGPDRFYVWLGILVLLLMAAQFHR